MKKFKKSDRSKLLKFLKIGKNKAVGAKKIASHLGFPTGGTQPLTRGLITECILLEGDLIGASQKGFFLIDTNKISEIEKYLDTLESRSKEMMKRRNSLIKSWKKKSSIPIKKKKMLIK